MDSIFIRRSLNGKTFVAAADKTFPGLEGKPCPFTGEDFEETYKEVNEDSAEIMGVNYQEVVQGLKNEPLHFGKFKMNLGSTLVME